MTQCIRKWLSQRSNTVAECEARMVDVKLLQTERSVGCVEFKHVLVEGGNSP